MAYIHKINGYDDQNDFGFGPGVSVFFNFCPFHCKNCWNDLTWERDQSLFQDNQAVAQEIIDCLAAFNNRQMPLNLSLLGGDPLVDENIEDTFDIIKRVTAVYPTVKIGVWTGFDIETWYRDPDKHQRQLQIIPLLDRIIDGRFIDKAKTKYQMFGSVNQRVIDTHKLYNQPNNIKQMLYEALVDMDKPLIVLSAPKLHFTTREFMDVYLASDKNRFYHLAVLHTIADKLKQSE